MHWNVIQLVRHKRKPEVDEALTRAWNQILARPAGSLQFRFILQPLLAVIIAIRAGTKDAGGPSLLELWSQPGGRKLLFRSTSKDVGKLFIMAVVLDCVYQVIEFSRIYPLQALIVGFALAIFPYLVTRGLVTRVVSWGIARRH